MQIALLCFLVLLGLGRDVFGCSCTRYCDLPEENGCLEGLAPLCEQNGDACVCACAATMISKTKQNLTIQVGTAAGRALAKTGYDLAIFKGYKGGSKESFDTAWHVVKNNDLVSGKLDLMWTSSARAAFVKKVEENDLILQKNTTISKTFDGGRLVVFDNSGWRGPFKSQGAVPPFFEVKYKPDSRPMHLTLLAPIIIANDTKWSPFFYDKYAMDQGAEAKGYPTSSLFVKLTRFVKAGTYTGLVYTTGKKIDYGDKDAMTICISTTKPSSDFSILLGTCEGNMEMA